MKVSVECEVGGKNFSITTGEIAKQASGAVLVQYGETVAFVAAQTGPPRPVDFFPLTVDYRERFASAGKFPGGFLKREGRPTQREILTCRLTDRPIRPLFPKGYHDEVQIMTNVLAIDGENDPDVLSINGASAALMIAPTIPFGGPIAAVRVGCINDEFIIFPTRQQIKESSLDLVVAGSTESVLMIEGFADQLPDDQMADAIMFAHGEIVKLCELQKELVAKVGVEPCEYEAPPENPFHAELREKAYEELKSLKSNPKKAERYEGTAALKERLKEEYFPEEAELASNGGTRQQFGQAFHDLEYRVIRDLILAGTRLDGRGPSDLREVNCAVDVVPRVHGSALFTRGETQSLASITLGTSRDAQRVEGPLDDYHKRFMLDYNFPPYSVGECRPIRGPGRREIGHGALAERSLAPVLPELDKFPYTIRVISDITESNGSSSMASVCSGTLAMMAAGVPIRQPVAGISIGVVVEGDDFTLLTDIMGDEDHFGDMDFKVAGTQKGITGIQLDLKISGISEEIIRATLKQASDARIELLRNMLTAIRRPRAEISPYAPRLETTSIDPEKIGLLIGPGGKTIRAIQEETGTQIDVEEDGTLMIAASSGEKAKDALARIEALTEDIKVGRVYHGTVSSVKDFGVFVEIAPGKDGLCHISELSEGFVKNVVDVCNVGDKLDVKVIAVDDQNRVKLSRKAVLAEQAAAEGKSAEE